MTADDMTVQDVSRADLVPGPRTASPALATDLSWVAPAFPRRGTHPCSEYWDVETARWTSRSPVPGPRQGDRGTAR